MICSFFIPVAEHNFLVALSFTLKKMLHEQEEWRHKKEMPVKAMCPSWALNMIGVQVGARAVNKAASEVLFLEAGEAGQK